MCPSYGTHGEGVGSLVCHGEMETVSPGILGCRPCFFLRMPNTHLDGTLQFRLLEAEPHHANDSQGHTQPIEETEEVDDGEDVIGEGVHQGHDTLKAKTGPGEPDRAGLMQESARGHQTVDRQLCQCLAEHKCLFLF